MAVANFRDLVWREFQIAQPIIDHDEIVPGTVHLAETQHAGWLPQSRGKAKPMGNGEAPSINIQAPKKLQIPSSNLASQIPLVFGSWYFSGAWCFSAGCL
jgi:hypothetical protein